MAKTPFEKVRSLVERKKLFESLLAERGDILCKSEDESLFHLKPTSLIGDTALHGYMESIESLPTTDTEILGNFSVGSERYFFQTQMTVKADEGTFQLACDVFKLQRRSALRLYVRPAYEMYLAVTEHQGKPVYAIAQLADISSGGARIFFSDQDSPMPAGNSKSLGLRIQDHFKGVLHLGKKKSIEMQCEVRHTQQAVHRGVVIEHFGIEFTHMDNALKNRLLALTMDLQKRMALED